MKLETATRRITGKKTKQLRAQDIIPLGLYGKKGVKNLKADKKQFEAVFAQAGEATLVDLFVDGKPRDKVLIDQLQYHPLTGEVVHASLRQVDLREKIKANVPLEFGDQSPAVQSGLGILTPLIDEVEVECLPGDLPAVIEVDTSSLAEVGDTLFVKDLPVDREKVVLELDDEEAIAKIDHAQMEEEEEEESAPAGEEGDGEREKEQLSEEKEGGEEDKEG